MNVTLPNGKVIEGVPEGTPKEAIRDKAISAGLATPEDFGIPSQPSVVQQAGLGFEPSGRYPGPTQQGVGGADWLLGNMDVPAGIAGALAGGRAASIGGPKAAIAGTVLGGMAGTFGGSLASDALTGEDLDYTKAVQEAAISGGIDLAFLGASKWAWPVIKSMRSNGKSIEDAVSFFKNVAQGGTAGSRSSLKASQAILQNAAENQGVKATLTPYQTNNYAGYQELYEQLARTGIFSQKAMAANLENVNRVVSGRLDELVSGGATSSGDLGEALYMTIASGKEALQMGYRTGLDNIAGMIGNQQVSIAPLRNFITKTVRQAGREESFSMLDDKVMAKLQDMWGSMGEASQWSAQSVVDFEKKFIQELRGLATDANGVYNSTIDKQVQDIIMDFQKANNRVLSKANPAAAIEYRKLQKEYSEGLGSLLPEVNQSFISRATKGNFTDLGRLASTNGSPERINALMRSIDRAYAQVSRIRGPNKPKMPFDTAQDAKRAIRQSYVQNLFPNIGPEFTIEQYANLAARYQRPDQWARLQAVMGEDAKYLKQLMNIMKEASEKPGSNIGELMLRAKEYGAIGTLGAGVITGSSPLLATSASILLAPLGLAKMATNPARINKLLAFSKQKFKTREAMELAFTNAFADVLTEWEIQDDE